MEFVPDCVLEVVVEGDETVAMESGTPKHVSPFSSTSYNEHLAINQEIESQNGCNKQKSDLYENENTNVEISSPIILSPMVSQNLELPQNLVPSVIMKLSPTDSPKDTLTMPVLKKEQIKKRLQSFSLLKQGKMLPSGLQNVPIKKIVKPKIVTQITTDETGEERIIKLCETKPQSAKKGKKYRVIIKL